MTVNDATHARLDELFASIDAMDTGRFLRSLTDNAVCRFGSAPPVKGQDAIHAAVDRFFIVARENRVRPETSLGGERFLEELEDDPLPRIC